MHAFPQIIAHRGASAEAPENTMAAFELAHRQGAQMIEFDVRPTAGGRIIVFHDDTTERWNGRPDPVGALPWERLEQLDIRGERIPTLQEVCRWAREVNMGLNIEIKVPGIEAAVAALVRESGLDDQVIVSSFYPSVLRDLLEVAPHLRRGALMGLRGLRPRLRQSLPLRLLRLTQAQAWHPAYQLPFLPRSIRVVHRFGYQVNVWTVDEPRALRRLIALGVDGIITNRPAVLRDLLAGNPVEARRPLLPRRRKAR